MWMVGPGPRPKGWWHWRQMHVKIMYNISIFIIYLILIQMENFNKAKSKLTSAPTSSIKVKDPPSSLGHLTGMNNRVSLGASIAVINQHGHKQLGERRVYIASTSSPIMEGIQGRN